MLCQIGLFDDRFRPHAAQKSIFGEYSSSPLHQKNEQVERLGADRGRDVEL